MRTALVASFFATCLLVAASVWAQAPATGQPAASPPAAASPEEIEEVEEVEVVEQPAGTAGIAPGQVPNPWEPRNFIGALHPAVIHLPIGWLFLTLLVDLAAFAFRREQFVWFGPWVLGATLVSAIPAMITGLVREGPRIAQVAEGPAKIEIHRLVETHETLIFVVAGLVAGAFLLRMVVRNRLDGAWKGVYLTLVVGATVLMAIAGHWGGKISGTNYLPF
jgi:uncharacterized membrane protein